jgi:LemA protein
MDPRAYRTYLIKFPQGQFKDEARARLGALLGEDYVALFTKRVSVNRQWANVERQLRRRADLIPLLISTLQEAGVHEPELFGQIAEARSSLLDAMSASPQGEEDNKTPEQKRTVIDADNGFGGILRRVDSLLENYPQLRSNEKFLKMQDEFAGVENRASVAQADYNGAVQEYNTARSQPQVAALAEQHGFTEEPYFKSEQAQPAEPRIKRA